MAEERRLVKSLLDRSGFLQDSAPILAFSGAFTGPVRGSGGQLTRLPRSGDRPPRTLGRRSKDALSRYSRQP